MVKIENALKADVVKKHWGGFELRVEDLVVPEGFATALVGENGAGKTTLLKILGGIDLEFKGDVRYFEDEIKMGDEARRGIGYVSGKGYLMDHWSIKQVVELSKQLYEDFDEEVFEKFCYFKHGKKVSELSDGQYMRLVLSLVWARKNTKLLLLDEPASPLDPLMRDNLTDMIRYYLKTGDGKKSVLFSTHNIADMESVTDYVIILDKGRVLENGFVEDLKEKYVMVNGEAEDAKKASKYMITCQESKNGFVGLILSENLDMLAGIDVLIEKPSLSNICVELMRANSKKRMVDWFEE